MDRQVLAERYFKHELKVGNSQELAMEFTKFFVWKRFVVEEQLERSYSRAMATTHNNYVSSPFGPRETGNKEKVFSQKAIAIQAVL